ncbi:MAG TPA: hypothetical protein VHB97_03245 [Polyangia bacterium]|jgi:hypothetical protein|nr:hypothetical protein [Polyangia bacterium]
MRSKSRSVLWLAPLWIVAGCGGVQAGVTPDLATTSGDGGNAAMDLAAPPGSDLAMPPPDLSPQAFAVGAANNVLELDTCQVTPAMIANIPAGTYTITLAASTLSKGTVATTPPQMSVDNYVIVWLPLGTGDAQHDRRFFMLNGIGANASFTLTATGTVQVMFVDSDAAGDTGQATVAVSPGSYSTTVDAVTNGLRWSTGCSSTPSELAVTGGNHTVTLAASTLALASGDPANYVILRMASEVPQDDHRYVMLNGVGASYAFNDTDPGDPLRAWFISPTAGSTGAATLTVSTP